jgi:hypothetical protein
VTCSYSGLLISRRNRFDALRVELLRHVNSIEFVQEPSRITVKRGTKDLRAVGAGVTTQLSRTRWSARQT